MRVLVLGCGGFIGSHLIERLLHEEAFTVSGVDLRVDKIRHLLTKPRFTLIQSDVYSLSGLESHIRNTDAVIALTAICNPSLYNKTPIDVIRANYDLPSRIVELCAKHGRWLVQFSTCEVYGKTPAMLDPSLKGKPFILDAEASPMVLGAVQAQRWTYACAKQLLERLVYSYGMERELPFTIVRPFNFIGPRMDYIPGVDGEGVPRVMACFMEALLFNKPLKLVDGGLNRRAFTDIRDAVDFIVLMLNNPARAQGKIFNVGNPENEVTIRELAERMLALYPNLFGAPLPAHCRLQEISGLDFYGPGYEDSDRRIPEISPARSLLGWNPGIPLGEALRYTMDGFIRQYAGVGQKE